MSLSFPLPETPEHTAAEQIALTHQNPGFGNHFTAHMAVAQWIANEGWHDDQVRPYGPFQLDPAAAVLHYAQEIFEGLKAYRHADGSIWAFRPAANAERFQRSARRLALPELPAEDFITSIRQLVSVDADWVPGGHEQSLYLRPFMFASEKLIGVRPAREVTYSVIASPVGAYFASGVKPVDIWVTPDYVRAAPGGTGSAKCGGNYAASLLAMQEAADHGCSQVLFVDGVERRWVEELGGMNVYLVTSNQELITPEITGTILEGITRDSILQIAMEHGLTPVERRIELTEMIDGLSTGRYTELFACGTAAVITPIGTLKSTDSTVEISDGTGEYTGRIREQLLDIQYGRRPDDHGWLTRLV